MTVSSLTTVAILLLGGTTLVTCTALPDKYGDEDQLQDEQDDNAPEVLYRALFGYDDDVSPRFLHSSSSSLSKASMYAATFEGRNRNLIDNLKLSVIFRDNVLYIFSYLLHGREDGLTEEQYTSLQMLYDVLRKRMVPVYSLLPILPKLRHKDKNYQTRLVLLSLTKNLPAYLQCTAMFLAQEIHMRRLNVNALIPSSDTFNYLANIKPNAIQKNKLNSMIDEEPSGYGDTPNVTQKALGAVYVKLLHELYANGLPLPQELFGLMLMNLPNPDGDPILEEHVRYLYDVMSNNLIMNWRVIGKNVVGPDAYTTALVVLSKLLSERNLDMTVKRAVVYVCSHLKLVAPTHANPYFKYMRELIKPDINIGLLLSAIVPQEFDADAIHMKDRLLLYFMRNNKPRDLDYVISGFNKYAYQDPLDLLMALLTRITHRVPTSARNILLPATALLPALIMKKHIRMFTPFVSPEIDVLMLMDTLKNTDLSPTFSGLDATMYELIAHLPTSELLNNLIPTDKSKCVTPRQCLTNTMTQIPKAQIHMPTTLTKRIQRIVHVLKSITPSQPSFSLPEETQVYGLEAGLPIIIEMDNMPGHSVPFLPLDINKFVHDTNPTYESPTKVISVDWHPEFSTESDSNEQMTSGYVIPSKNPRVPGQSLTVVNVSNAYLPIRELSAPGVKHRPRKPKEPYRPNKKLPQIIQSHVPDLITQYPENSFELNYAVHLPELPDELPYQPSVIDDRDTPYVIKDTRRSTVPNQMQTTKKPLDLSKLVHKTPRKTPSRRPSHKVSHMKPTTPASSPKHSNQLEKILEQIHKIPISSMESVENVNVNINVNGDGSYEKPKHPMKERPRTKDIPETANPPPAMLPPSIKPDKPLAIQLSGSGVPVVTMNNPSQMVIPGLVLPGIKELLKPANLKNPLGNTDELIVVQVLQPLSAIFGKNYVRHILKEVNPKLYPTNIALLLALFKKAKNLPQVTRNSELSALIRKYIATMEYISPTILLPFVISMKRLTSDIVYSTFNPYDAIPKIEISEYPPDEISANTIIIPIVNPKIWLQSVDPVRPYDLIPTLPVDDPLAATLQPLKAILTIEKISELFGPDFQPLAYPNKGALLITILHKLRRIKQIELNPSLMTLINNYIIAVEMPSMQTQVSEDNFVKMMSESKGYWQPELMSLLSALPTAKNDAEMAMLEIMEQFLSDPSVLERLHVEIPSSTMSRGEFLHKIIQSALSGKVHLDKQMVKAFRYYVNRVEFNDMGALPIMWAWVEVYVVRAEIQLGSMIQQTLDFNKLAYREKLAYNDVISYLAENVDILQNNDDFDFESYRTQGEFVKALFQYIMKKPQVSDKIERSIRMLLPHVKMTGAGAIALPSLSSESFGHR